jgi:choline kinase
MIKMKDIAIVYMVAGMSSRFGGKIKQFAKVGPNDETLIECSLKQSLPAGFTKIIFIVGNKTESVFKEKFGNSFYGIPVLYAKQEFSENERDKPWGTCDALCSIKKIIDCPFVVCNGDDLYSKKAFSILTNHFNENKETKENATLGYKLINALYGDSPGNRAIFKIKNDYVEDIKEVSNIQKSNFQATNTKPDDRCSMNIFALYPETINLLNQSLELFKKNHQGDRRAECLLPDEISALVKKEKIKLRIYPIEEKPLGVTIPEDEAILKEILKNNEE